MAHAPTTSDWAIDLSHVSKIYEGGFRRRGVHALRGVDMRVRRGEVFGLLGPNGAGKSTLVKILMTVIRATRAEGTMLGAPIGHKPTLARVGYLPEHHRFPDYLTGEQVVDMAGAMCGVPRQQRRARTGSLLELVGMRDWAKKRVRGYSKGMRQRVGIAQALAADPELVVLDEPTDGVDPVGRRDIREVLMRLQSEGRTVFLNSHLLSELEMVCDRVAIMVQGLVTSQGTLDELTVQRQMYEIDACPSGGGMESPVTLLIASGAVRSSAQHAAELPTGECVEFAPPIVRVRTIDAVRVQPILDALRASAWIIRSVRPIRPSLEDLFMEAVTDPTTGRALAPGAKGGGS